MDRRFTNVISTVADTALELRTGLAKYWRTRMALVDQGYRPELHYMRGPGPKWREAHARLAEPPITYGSSARTTCGVEPPSTRPWRSSPPAWLQGGMW
jgi:hypothetical protein